MSRTRFLAWYFAAWVPVAVVYSLLIHLSNNRRDLEGALVGGAQSILYAAVLGLLAWRAAERLAERQRPAAALLGAHLGLGVLYSSVWTALVLVSILAFAPPDVYASFVRYALGWELLTGFFLYGIVAGVAHGVTVNGRLRRERDAASRAEALRARAELHAVRAQIHPHFLFNTLHSIAALVRSDPDAAERALERLATLLRRLMDETRGSADRVPLGEEWAIVREQLALEQLRFGDRLGVAAELEPDALDCLVPVLTLQPLVENAIKHAVAPRSAPTTVHIGARIEGELLVVEVRDDGRGADPRAAMSAPGLGLRAVKQRLLAAYGDRGGLHVESSPGAGFRAVMSLPAVSAPAALPAGRAVAAATP